MFPLGSVLVPGAVLPLHVFEPRYRALVDDCLAGAREFGVTLIERGSEVGGGDARTDVGTVAHIVEASRFDDGRWALAAVGTRRIRVERWLPDEPYPRAEVTDWPDVAPTEAAIAALDAVRPLLRRVLALATELGLPTAPATTDLDADPLVASYQAVALSPFGPADRQELLCAAGPDARLERLASMLADEETFLTRRLELDAGDADGTGPAGG